MNASVVLDFATTNLDSLRTAVIEITAVRAPEGLRQLFNETAEPAEDDYRVLN